MTEHIPWRRYQLLKDFPSVYRFLGAVYRRDTLNSYLLPPFFEYAHTHPAFNNKQTHRFGLWEAGGKLVAIACYEMDVGACFLVTDRAHAELLPDMLTTAERELSVCADGRSSLSVWVTDREADKRALLAQRGYVLAQREAVRMFPYTKPFPERRLPDGFSVLSLDDENDPVKIHACLWKGFDHGDQPDDDWSCRLHMQSGPHFRKDLTTVIKAPNGDYACFAGMWLDEANGYAYLEPLATVPAYRRLGLASVALTEGMKKTRALGAAYCFGGEREFYSALGFEMICQRERWKKTRPSEGDR
ncbi:MAG: GNAT family N-acetyltransferase [Clostridiaceae bacterium]|nr:GNAT family N-acetyltransferase [Clostridiaceae bacterium]